MTSFTPSDRRQGGPQAAPAPGLHQLSHQECGGGVFDGHTKANQKGMLESNIHINVHTNIHTNVHTNIHTNVHTNINTNIRTNIHANVHTNAHTNVRTNIKYTYEYRFEVVLRHIGVWRFGSSTAIYFYQIDDIFMILT